MATPTDEALYNKTKAEVNKTYDKPSAYRSMAYTRFYLRAYRDKYGDDKKAYTGKKPGDLAKWRNDKWVDVRSYVDTPNHPKACGNVKYDKGEYPLCMPEKKVKKYTQSELTALINRKDELGKKRLVKEPYLRDLGVGKEKVVKMKKTALIKEHKKLVKTLEHPTKKALKSELKEQSTELKEYEAPVKRPRGRPRVEKPVMEPVIEKQEAVKKNRGGRPRTSQEELDRRKAEAQAQRDKQKQERLESVPKRQGIQVHHYGPGENIVRFD